MTISHIIRFTALAYLLHCLPANANYHTTYSLTETITDNNQTTSQDKTYSYNSRDQLQQVQDAIGGALITYQYDNNGNQISKTDMIGTTNLVYGIRDRLLTITLPGAPPIAYSYNEAGLRDSQSQNGQTLHYIYDQTSLIAETNTTGDELARYTHSSVGMIAEARSGVQTYLHTDALSTPIAVTDIAGGVTTRYTWDTWGNLQQQTGISQQPFGFTGYQRDAQTGLHYAQQRYYDAEIGRFNRHDPFRGDIDTPLSLHRYLYANANPTIFVDPTGEFPTFLNQNEIDQIKGKLLGVDVTTREGIEELRAFEAGQIKGVVSASSDAVIGTVQFAADIPGAVLERSSGFALDFGSNDRIGAQTAAVLQLASAPITTISNALSETNASISLALAEGRFTDAGEQTGRLGTNAVLTLAGLPAAGKSALALSSRLNDAAKKANNAAFRVVEDGLDTGITPMLPGSLRSELTAVNLNTTAVAITDPARLLPAPGAIRRQEVPAFGLVVVNEDVFTQVAKRGILGREGSNNPGFFADPSELVGLSDEFVVQRLGNPFLGRKAVNNSEPLFGIQFPTSGQPIFNTLDFSDPNFVRGGRAVLKGPEEQNSFIIIQVREFNVPAQFKLPNGTIGGRLVNGAIQGSTDIR